MKLKHWIRFLIHRDSTWHGQFKALAPLLLDPPGIPRWVVDVGANDGFFSSNSYPFLTRGWRGLLIEPHPSAHAKANRLHRRRTGVAVIQAGCSDSEGTLTLRSQPDDEGGSLAHLGSPDGGPAPHSGIGGPIGIAQVRIHRLERLLEENRVPVGFGLLSIDTEGHDLRVLMGANLDRFRPAVIITETSKEDQPKREFLGRQGYRLHLDLEFDSIWIRGGTVSG